MTGPFASTRHSRDFPVLRAIAEHVDQDLDDIIQNGFEGRRHRRAVIANSVMGA